MARKPADDELIELDADSFTDILSGAADDDRVISKTVIGEEGDIGLPGDDELEIVDDDFDENLETGVSDVASAADHAANAGQNYEEAPLRKQDQAQVGVDENKSLRLQLINSEALRLNEREANANERKTRAERMLQTAETRLLAAKESGDSKAEIAIQNEILDAREMQRTSAAALQGIENQRGALRIQLSRLGYTGKVNDQGQPVFTQTKPQGQSSEQPRHSKFAQQFMTQNKWMNDPKYAAARARFHELDAEMSAAGKDFDDPRYFAELGAKFNREFPGIYRGLDGKPVATGRQQRGAAAAPAGSGVMPSSGAASRASVSSIRLNNQDIRTMKAFHMDPKNKEHLREFLANKRQRILRERQQQGAR